MQGRSRLALGAAVGAVTLMALSAVAQQPSQTPPGSQPAAPPASEAPPAPQPSTEQRPNAGNEAQPGRGERGGQRGRWADSEGNRGRGHMGRGANMGHGMEPMGMDMGMRGQRWRNMSEADRKAFFEARIAAIRAGLMLNETQQRLWPAVEEAMREMVAKRQAWRERIRQEGRPASPIDRLKQRGEFMSERGAALQKYANSAKPLYDSLSDEQKRRLRILTRGFGQQGARRGRHAHGYHHGRNHGGERGWQRHGEHRGMHGEGRWQRHGQAQQRWNRSRDGGDDYGVQGRGMAGPESQNWQSQGRFEQRWNPDGENNWNQGGRRQGYDSGSSAFGPDVDTPYGMRM